MCLKTDYLTLPHGRKADEVSLEGVKVGSKGGKRIMFTDATALVRLHEIEQGLDDRTRPDDGRGRAEIERCRAEIDPPLLAKYEQLKVRYGPGAVAPADDGICSGCRISLPSSVAGRLRRGVAFCDHCGRILYDADRVFNLQY